MLLQYSTEGKIKEPNLAAEAGQGLLSAVTSYARGDMGGVFKSAMGLVKTASGNTQKAERYARATRTSPADAVSNLCISLVRRTSKHVGCRYLGVGVRILRPVLILKKLDRQPVL